MDFDINALDLLWVTLSVIAYASGAALWAYLSVPRERRQPRVTVLPATAYFESAPHDDLVSVRARLAK